MLPRRRDALLSSVFGPLALRSIATGLPAWYLLNPRQATAQQLECAIANKDTAQYLIVSVSSNGDPINCNCPGTYDGDAAAAIHPADAMLAATPVSLGGKNYTGAAPWAGLSQAVRDRTAFFHHVTLSNVHGDQPKVMKLMGATSAGEMIVSAYAKHLSGCLGTVQPEPVALGARGNSSELVSYAGRALPSISPTQLKQLITGSTNGGTTGGRAGSNPAATLLSLRSVRDKYLDQLNAMAKSDATGTQQKFLDAYSTSQAQVRMLKDTLATQLNAISGDDIKGQALAAAALIVANVTPVVTVHIPFGGDNHNDANLATEVTQTVSGVAAIQSVMDAIPAELKDRVTFATLNVFGRNLNGISKVMMQQGRDHYGNHSVAVLIGKNIKAGVYGGVTAVSDKSSNGALGAGDIDSASGALQSGGDIPRTETHVAMARTLGAALGIPASALAGDFVAGSNTKIVTAALNGITP